MGKVIEAKQIVKPKKRRHRVVEAIDGPPGKARKLLPSNQANAKTAYHALEEDDKERVILQEKTYADLVNPDDIRLKIKSVELYDLFLDDELTNSYFCYFKDIYFHILDEIALEGLDGITFEAFWKRLSVCLQKPFYRNTNIEQLIWRMILDNGNLQFYKLVESRKQLIIFNRYNYVDPELGNICDMSPATPDIYPYHTVTAEHVQGSCKTFDTRVNITEEIKFMSLREVLKNFGSRVVIVADQVLRTTALLFEMTDPLLQLTPHEYGILERIGRARHHGELTAGVLNMSHALNMDNKSIHHYQKRLVANNFITKQHFYLKSYKEDQNTSGSLLILSRFYCKVKNKQLILTDKVVNILKNMPDYRCEMRRLSNMFKNNYRVLRRAFKTSEFKRFVKPDILVPYRTIYPDASRDEYMRKANTGEKLIRVCELIDPNINVVACWNNLIEVEEEEEDDEESREVEATGDKIFNMNISREVYTNILQSGKTGMTHMDVLKAVGMNFYIIRMALRRLLARDVITKKLTDGGRQRYAVYYAKCLGIQDKPVEQIDVKPKIEEMSSIKARMIEKQRAAIQKQGCEDYVLTCSEMPASGIGRCFTKFLNIERNFIPTCVFLIKDVSPMNAISAVEDLTFDRYGSRNYSIKLKYISNGKQIPINDWLRELNPKVDPDTKKLRHVYIENDNKFKIDFTTKLILLKLSFQEIELSKESFEAQGRKRKLSVCRSPTVKASTGKLVNEKLNYMGSNPEIIWKSVEEGLEEVLEMSTRPEQYRYGTVFCETGDLSERVVTRLQNLLDLINKVRVLEDMTINMIKYIEEIEVKAGVTYRFDRKSLARLLKRLVKEGYIKIYRLTIQSSTAKRTQLYACHPSVEPTDPLLRQYVAQVKFKYFIAGAKRNVKSTEEEDSKLEAAFRQGDVVRSVTEWNNLKRKNSSDGTTDVKTSLKMARLYGIKPKFIRMRILHELLYYLTYVHNSSQEPLNQQQMNELFKTYGIELNEEEVNQMPPIYCKELSWRTFIAPLPEHKNWPVGWVLLLDVIMRLPVCLFLKVHSCTVECPQLLEICNHPIKRFYAVKDLPPAARSAILHKGKYSTSIYEVVSRLAFCGLVQFGPQKSKDKEQIFIYVNKSASLFDTTSSESGYNKVTEKEYPQINFYFNSLADIESFWAKLHCISMSTKLNTRVPGQLVTYTDLSANPSLKKALDFRMPSEAVQYDNGEIPGDRRGAAGLDSSLWSHINRNWCWTTGNNKKRRTTNIKKKNIRVEKRDLAVSVPFNQLDIVKYKVYLHNDRPLNKAINQPQIKFNPFRTSKRNKLITRVVKPRSVIRQKRVNLDHTDKMIVKKLGLKTRVKFTKEEDRLLTLCKAGDMLLGMSNTSGHATVTYGTIRDVMHRVCPDSRNKTFRALDRRIRTHVRSNLSLENVRKLMEIPDVKKYLLPFVKALDYPKERRPKESQIRDIYVTLMAYIFQHQNEVSNLIQGSTLSVDHLHPDSLAYTEENLDEKLPIIFKEAESEKDITRDCIKTVVLSSLLCVTSAVRLFKVYERYSDSSIREAVDELQKVHMISVRKKTKKLREQIVWQIPYKLSNKFHFLLGSIYDSTTTMDAYQALKLVEVPNKTRIIDWTPELAKSFKYGRLLGFNEFFSMWDKVRFKFNVPESTVILNPDIEDHSALVNEIALRYQIKIKRMVQEKAEPDPEEEEIDHQSTHTDDHESTQTKNIASQSKFKPPIEDDMESPEASLDVDVEANKDTIDRLKSWVSDCMQVERRSPSPEFIVDDQERAGNTPGTNIQDQRDEDLEQETVNVSQMRDEKSDKNTKFDYVPSLEEIKEELIKITPPDHERRIPYITDLNDLLNRDSFNETKISDDELAKLKNHFVTQYTSLENFILDDFEQLLDSPVLKFIEDRQRNLNIWEKVKCELFARDFFSIPKVNEAIGKACGGVEDMEISNEIVEYILTKRVFGATGPELQRVFAYVEKSFLVTNVMRLIDAGILVRVGICSLRFVHYTHRSMWLVDAHQISAEELKDEDEEYVRAIAKRLEGCPTKSVRVVPWAKIDGQLDEQMFNEWLCRVLSHIVNNPKITFWNVCAKFRFLKPVEIFYLLEVLQEIGCVKLYTYGRPDYDVFSEWTIPYEEYTTILDDFEDVCVQPTNVSMLALGSFYHSLTTPSGQTC